MPSEIIASYRVQLHAGFGFDEAAGIADYLTALGISHLYCSPYLQAAKGSTHGYDVVDPRRVNEELGGAEAHARLCASLKQHGLGQLLDIVPNHMAVSGAENPWWWDVLENGPSSLYAAYFDVDWDPPEAKLANTVLLPVLGDHYGRVLEAGEIKLGREDGAFAVRYHDHLFPVDPRSLDGILAEGAQRCGSDDLAFVADACARLPMSTAANWSSAHRRHRDKEVLRIQLARLLQEKPEVAAAVDAMVAEVNADPDKLDALLERQNYRLAFWRAAGRELGYRRFFDINTLVGLRSEDERVFRDTHALVLEWLASGVLDGVRVDHPDGLRDPEGYFRRLREACPRGWVVAEKILESGERLRGSWLVDGTTGYDFANRVGGLFVDPPGEEAMTDFYAEFTGEPTDFAVLVRDKKHQVLRDLLGSDINRLTELFVEVCERRRRYRDYTRHELHETLREAAACFPVYRTYVQAKEGKVDEEDSRYVVQAVEAAKAHRPDLDPELFDFFRDLLLLKIRGEMETELVMRFQQLTGPAMAKGVEDTAFYCFNRLVSLNEVGGDPSRFGVSVEEFHRASGETQQRWPRMMITTSTHDSKRSEDVRARLGAISEIPGIWREAVKRWSTINAKYRTGDLPDRNAEYLFYQTLVGAWPIGVDRAVAYMEKAARETKVYTSWIDPDSEYEEALRGFVQAALDDKEFTRDLEAFVAFLIEPGRVNSLAKTLIKLTAPGVPDFYQGSELWDLSLVDPDNRRPVDFDLRRRFLAELDGLATEDIWRRIDEGLPKLWVIQQGLRLRRNRPELFGPAGNFRPLHAQGRKAEHVVAFSRGEAAITVVPRLLLKLGGAWGETALEVCGGRWRNALTGEEFMGGRLSVARLFEKFPVALLSKEEAGS